MLLMFCGLAFIVAGAERLVICVGLRYGIYRIHYWNTCLATLMHPEITHAGRLSLHDVGFLGGGV